MKNENQEKEVHTISGRTRAYKRPTVNGSDASHKTLSAIIGAASCSGINSIE